MMDVGECFPCNAHDWSQSDGSRSDWEMRNGDREGQLFCEALLCQEKNDEVEARRKEANEEMPLCLFVLRQNRACLREEGASKHLVLLFF